MSLFSDALVGSIAKVVLAILRSTNDVDYRALYPGEVLESDGNKATVRLDDDRIGTLNGCRVHRPDGWTSTPSSGTRCLVGWYGYNPSLRYCISGFDGNGTVRETTIAVDSTLNLGSAIGTQAVVLQPIVNALTTVLTAVGTFATATGAAVPALSVPAAALNTAIGVFTGLSSTFTTTKTKAI